MEFIREKGKIRNALVRTDTICLAIKENGYFPQVPAYNCIRSRLEHVKFTGNKPSAAVPNKLFPFCVPLRVMATAIQCTLHEQWALCVRIVNAVSGAHSASNFHFPLKQEPQTEKIRERLAKKTRQSLE